MTLMRLFRRDRVFVPVMLALLTLAICLRMPEIILKGRFWAEEGNIFFRNAWLLPPMRALLNPYGGYLNLAANGGTLAARWLLPLRLAPYLTIGLALVVQLCPLLLLLDAGDELASDHGRPGSRRCCWCCSCRRPRRSGCNTLHCQFELGLCVRDHPGACGRSHARRAATAFRWATAGAGAALRPRVPLRCCRCSSLRAALDRDREAAPAGAGARAWDQRTAARPVLPRRERAAATAWTRSRCSTSPPCATSTCRSSASRTPSSRRG